jgi:tRNA (guanine37-N1)-methyltransferase
MVMKPEPWSEALDELAPSGPQNRSENAENVRLVVPTPSGRPFTQRVAEELAQAEHLVFAPARYEGIDRRFIEAAAERMPVDELSIGDYVLAGGEVAVLVMVEAVGRLLPGVLGNAESAKDDSFGDGTDGAMAGLLEGPVYTKPAAWQGREVPPTLLSGNHAAIARWRRDEALRRTAEMRPDLIAALDPKATDKKDRALLSALGWWETADGFRPGDDV